MISKLPNPEKPKPVLEQVLPVLITFGPFCMVIGLYGSIKGFTWSGFPVAVIGYVMLSIGLAWLYRKQTRIETRLDELERLKDESRAVSLSQP